MSRDRQPRSTRRAGPFFLAGTAIVCIAPLYLLCWFGRLQNRLAAIPDQNAPPAETSPADGIALRDRREAARNAAVDEFFDAAFIRAVIIFVCTAPFAGYLFAYGRRLESKSGAEVMAIDPRPPVVYFRSFEDDDRPAYEGLATAFSPLRWGRTQEEEIVKSLQGLGPVVAIGNPNEQTPLAGAARFYSRNEEWQAVAHQLLEKAALVVYRQGRTPGFVWEIERGRKHLEPRKMLLLILDLAGYDSFRQILSPHMTLPPRAELRSPLITFDADWTPVTFDSGSLPEPQALWSVRTVSKCVARFVGAKLKRQA